MSKSNNNRIRILSFFILFFSIVIIARLYFLQIVSNDQYLLKADRQYINTSNSVFSRGNIFFQSKDNVLIGAGTLKSGFTLAINPMILKDKELAYQKISEIVEIDKEMFLEKAGKINDPYEEIAKRIDYNLGKKIEGLAIKGVGVYLDRWRFYPAEKTASNTIGFMAFKGDEYAGRYGLERFYEDVLKRDKSNSMNFFAQIFSNIKDNNGFTNEGDIVTSIEPTVQSSFDKELAQTNEKYSSEGTFGIIINPKNGQIIAMSVYPSFDLNNTKEVKNINIFSNPLVENVYEMGSIIKPLTVATGLDLGLITATTTYYDPGFVYINSKKISNFDGKERGVVDIQTALSQSLNVGMTEIVKKVGIDKFSQYFKNFGLNQRSDIDLPNEAKNLVDNLDSPRDIEHYTASFGQGIAMTPISTVRALSVLANGGVLIKPHLVNRINYKVGIGKDIEYVPTKRVIKKETADEITRMLVKNVDTALRDGTVKFPNHSVAAKTGTAQIAVKGGYSEDDFLHSFFGYVPAYNPKFFIFLMTVKPRGVQYSSESLTDPFINTVKFLINYYQIPPDR